MSTRRFGAVRFFAYPADHSPRHVHGHTGETTVIVTLGEDREVGVANRKYAIRPANAKRADVRKILETAVEHFDELVELWESMHA